MISVKQIILLTSAAGAVGVLSLFPIGVIKQKRSTETAALNKQDTSSAMAAEASHTVEVPAELKEKINQVKKQGAGAKVSETIGDMYAEATLFDSAAHYYGLAIKVKDQLSTKIKLADSYYNLFGVSGGTDTKSANKCKEVLKEILTVSPSDMDSKAKLGYITTLTSEMPMEGVGILNEVLQQAPDNRTALFNLGLLGIRSRQFDKAKARFEKILAKESEDQVARFYLAACYKETGDLAKARELVKIITESKVDPVIASEARRLLVE